MKGNIMRPKSTFIEPSFHENLNRNSPLPHLPNRRFGWLVGGAIVVVASIRTAFITFNTLEVVLFCIGAILVSLGTVYPRSLRLINIIWTRVAWAISKFLEYFALLAIFIFAITPIGLIRRIFTRDALGTRFDPARQSYWTKRDSTQPNADSMKNEF